MYNFSMLLLKGKPVAEKILENVKREVEHFKKAGVHPRLVVIMVGDNPASKVYVSKKEEAAGKVGIESTVIKLNSSITEHELLNLIDQLNADETVHGILVQLPLPSHINPLQIQKRINPLKDVDGFHPENIGLLWAGSPRLVPCTPKGIIELLKFYEIPIKAKNAVVVGRSNIVGKPMAALLLSNDATVTVAHSKTSDLKSITRQADILVVATGKPGLITGEMVKEGSVVIDVGITRTPQGLKGDVEFEEVKEKVQAITPVPGGVGPLTIASLMDNLLTCTKLLSDKKIG